MSRRVFTCDRPRFRGTIAVPGDKSLSHRALILSGFARGRSRVAGLGPGGDVAATAACLGELGVAVTADEVSSPGVEAWLPPPGDLDAGNSGTTMRLLAGALAGRPFSSRLVGDASLMRRPMTRLKRPLEALGARVATHSGLPPLEITGGSLQGAEIDIEIPSAQVRSAVCLAALQATGPSTIDSPPGFRDHTERWLSALGLGEWRGGTRFEIHAAKVPPLDLAIPRDPSSAAFMWTAAALGGGEATTRGVSLNPGRTGLLEVLAAMGAEVDVEPRGDVLGDPYGDVTVRGPVVRGASVDGSLAVRCLDELPLVALLGTVAEGETTVSGAGELRAKESNRIATTVEMIRSLRGEAEPTDDGFVVRGEGIAAGAVDSRGDHRIAMAAAAAATVAGTVMVEGMEAAAHSWPGFETELEALWSSR